VPSAFAAAERVLRLGLWVGCALFGSAWGIVAANRLAHPFELDKMEGGTVDHVVRVLAGLPLYVAPSPDFVPYSYTPLFPWVAALVASLTGPGFLPLRVVSIVASVGAIVLVAAIVRRETRDALAAALAAGLFVALFPRGGGWLDVGRVDSLFLALLLASIWLLRGPGGGTRRLVAGILLGLAFLTKQTALPLLVPCTLYVAVRSRREAAVFALVALAMIGVACAALDHASDSWFRFYTFTLQSRIPILPGMIPHYVLEDLWRPLAVALLLGGLHVLVLAASRAVPELAFHVLVGGGVLATIWLARISFGAYDNVLLPAHAVVSIGFGLGFASAHRLARSAGPLAPALGCFVALAAGAQLASQAYDPRRFVPSPADRAAGERLVALLRGIDGPVLVAHHGWLATLAGKPAHAHGVAISDLVLRDAGGPAESAFSGAMRRDLLARRWSAVLTDTEWWYDAELEAAYVRSGPVLDDPNVFFPITGARSRPEWLWTPRPTHEDRDGRRGAEGERSPRQGPGSAPAPD
jgi:hypothetical protein